MPLSNLEWLDALVWPLVIAGLVLVVGSWSGRLPQRYGWSGVWLALTGAGLSWAEPRPLQLTLLLAGAAAAAFAWLPRRKRRGWTPKILRRSYRPWDHESELVHLCRGDKAMAERLIRYELERNPKLSRAGAALSAATRLRHEQK